MKEKRYSISQIQKIIDISPNELKKLINKNSSRIKISTCELPDGSKETFLDEDSFKKLLFLKQLETGFKPSVGEICELMSEMKIHQEEEESVSDVADDPYFVFDKSLDAVEQEVNLLRNQLTRLIIKYDHCIKELNLSRTKNVSLENDIKNLRNREAALMGQMRKDSTEFYSEELSETDLN